MLRTIAITAIAAAIISITAFAIFDPRQDPKAIEAAAEARRQAYHKWCKDQGGWTIYDRRRDPYQCNVPSH